MQLRRLTVGVAFLMLLAATSEAGTILASAGPNETGDDTFQNAVGLAGATLSIENMEGLADGSHVSSLLVGTTNVSLSLANGGTTFGSPEVFTGSFGGGGGTATTVFSKSLLNRDATGAVSTQIVFDFPTPVFAAGIWAFDNSSTSIDKIRWSFTEVGGSVNSLTLDAIPGSSAHVVEGFVGFLSNVGITRLHLTSLDTNNTPQQIAFEVDNLQIGVIPSAQAVPLPTALWPGLALMGLLFTATIRRHRA